MTFAAIQNRLGVQPVGTTVTCVNKSGTSVAIGDLVITSFIHAGAVVDPQQAANTGYVFNCIRKAVSTETGNTGYLGVVTGLMAGAGANGREVEVQFGGICQAKVLVNATVSSGTLLGVSSTAGVLTNTVSTMTPGGYSVTLMDNAAVADGTALKRVYIPTEYTYGSVSSSIPGFYGSRRAGAMLRDAVARTDSLDVIVIGDSNATFPGSGGYNNAWHRVFNTTLRVPVYATPLFCGGMTNVGAPTAVAGVLRDSAGLGIGASSTAAGVLGTTGTSKMLATSQADANILALTNYLGMSVTGWDQNDKTTNSMMFPLGYGANPIVVETAGTFLGTFGQSSVQVSSFNSAETSTSTSWGSELVFGTDGAGAGVSLAYRIVYGTFAAGSGQFKPRTIWSNSTALHSQDSAFRSTNTGSVGYTTYSYPIPAVTFSIGSGQKILHCSWDGNATGVANTTGPFACLWNSVVKTGQKGYSVSLLNGFGGLNSALTLSKITNAGKLVDAYLKEIRERQVACGGTGRAMVFMNLGINTVEDATTWTTNSQAIIDLFRTKWVAGGGDVNNISFLFTVTHPVTSSGTPFDSTRTAISNAANAYATANGSTYNLCVIDIASFYSSVIMSKYNMYDSGGNAHLNVNPNVSGTTITTKEDSYFAITQMMASTLLASA